METPAVGSGDGAGVAPLPSIWRGALGKLVAALAVGAAAFLLITAFTDAETGTKADFPKGLENVTPLPGSLTVPNQSPISVDLAFDQEGVLLINGREIPVDQMQDFEPSTGVLTFVPGKDEDGNNKDFVRLPGGVVNLQTIFWPRVGDRETDGQSFRWTITVS